MGSTKIDKLSQLFRDFGQAAGGSLKHRELISIVKDLDSSWTAERLDLILSAAGAISNDTVDYDAMLQYVFAGHGPAETVPSTALQKYFLSQAYADGKTMSLDATGYRQSTTAPCYVHEASGYVAWQDAVDFRPPLGSGNPLVLLFYCPEMTFHIIVGEPAFSANALELMRQRGANGADEGFVMWNVEPGDFAVQDTVAATTSRKFGIPIIVSDSMVTAGKQAGTFVVKLPDADSAVSAVAFNVERRKRNVVQVLRRELGNADPKALGAMNDLAFFLEARGKLESALEIGRQCLDASEAALGPNDQMTLTCVANVSYLLEKSGDIVEAEKLARRALAGREATLGLTHNDTLTSVYNLAQLLESQKRLQEAEELYKRELEACTAVHGARSWQARESSRNHLRFMKQHRRGSTENAKKVRSNRFGTST